MRAPLHAFDQGAADETHAMRTADPWLFPPLQKGGRGDLLFALRGCQEQIPLDPPCAKGEDKRPPFGKRSTR